MDLAALVNLGATLALATRYRHELEPRTADSQAAVMGWLGVTEKHLRSVDAALPGRVAELESASFDD